MQASSFLLFIKLITELNKQAEIYSRWGNLIGLALLETDSDDEGLLGMKSFAEENISSRIFYYE